jgi:hypothetical protein
MLHNMTPQLWQKIRNNLNEAFFEARGTRKTVEATADGFMPFPDTLGRDTASRGPAAHVGHRLSRRSIDQKDSSKIGKTDSDRAKR